MRIFLISLVIVFAVGGSSGARADDSAAERASLTGLTKLTVVVEDPGQTAAKNGLAAAALETDTLARLRGAGLAVTADADAYLYVHVRIADAGGTLPLVYSVEVGLMQEVTLPRGVKTLTPLQSQTWGLNALGLASPDRLRAAVTDRVHQFVDQFVVAYRSVNPKP